MTETLKQAVDDSIKEAVSRGAIDTTLSAAPIAMLRAMAELIDGDSDSGTPAFRYVTPASFLSYCDALNLIPPKQLESSNKPKEEGAYARFLKNSRYSKLREGYARSNGQLDLSD